MSERCATPACRRVTRGAGLRESRRSMVGIRDGVVFAAVAGIAVGRCACITSADMTVRALHGGVRASERERRPGVIESGTLPLRRVMADRAILRECCGHVIRRRRGVEFGQVTTGARRAQSCITSTDMTVGTSYCGVRPSQREERSRMVECGAQPLRRRMTQ